MKKLILIVTFLSGGLAFGQTNEFYITDESLLGREKPGRFSSEQIEAAKHAKDSRPAKEDPESNWGAVLDGFQLSVRLEKSLFTNGEPVQALVILRNVSDRTLEFQISTYGDPDLDMILTKGADVLKRLDQTPGTNFVDTVRRIHVGSFTSASCLPGTQRKFTIDLNKIYGPITNGIYEVQARKLIPKMNEHAKAEVTSGKATFRIEPQP